MATLAQVLNSFAALVGVNVKDLRDKVGDLTTLNTTQKSNLVAALNEVLAAVGGGGGSSIDDANIAANTTYSSQKIVAAIQAAIDGLKGSAPLAYDTLEEIAAYLSANDTASAALLTSVSNRLRFDEAQVLNATQIQNVYTSLDLGNKVDIDNLVTAYTNARDGLV